MKKLRLSRSTVSRLALVLFLTAIGSLLNPVGAQTVTTGTASIPGCNTTTDGPCCYNIIIDPAKDALGNPIPLTSIRLKFSNPGCWDMGSATPPINCWEAELNALAPAITYVQNAAGDYTITFTPAVTTEVSFHVCPYLSCTDAMKGHCDWWSQLGNRGGNNGTVWFDPCPNLQGGGSFCPDCDYTNLQVDGFFDGGCYDRACFTKRKGAAPSSGPFKIHFTPDWAPCTPPGGHVPECAPGATINMDYTGFTVLPGTPGGTPGSYSDFFLQPPPNFLVDPCTGFCVNIPKCSSQVHYTVWIEDLSDPGHDCKPHPSQDFKILTDPGSSSAERGEPNYPNPVSSSTQFRTTIPFEVAATEGEARITIFDQNGKQVHTETMTFSGAGKHFFYFTADDLPSGSYVYSIESPLGLSIVKRNLLIVK